VVFQKSRENKKKTDISLRDDLLDREFFIETVETRAPPPDYPEGALSF